MNLFFYIKILTTYLKLKTRFPAMRNDIWRLDLFLYSLKNRFRIVNENRLAFKVFIPNMLYPFYIMRHYPSSDFNIFRTNIIQKQYDCILKLFADSKEPLKIIDAGANVGYSMMYFKNKFPDAFVICVEPDYGNISILNEQIKTNNLSNITVVNKALWYEMTSLFISRNFGDKREHSIRTIPKYLNEENPTQVDTLTLLHLMEMQKWGQIDFLKIDIEGAEAEIFGKDPNLKTVLQKTKMIAIEIHEQYCNSIEIREMLRQVYTNVYQDGELTVAYNN